MYAALMHAMLVYAYASQACAAYTVTAAFAIEVPPANCNTIV
jgi:hypothetical protein